MTERSGGASGGLPPTAGVGSAHGSHAQPIAQELSAYERERLANIARNNEMLRALGVDVASQDMRREGAEALQQDHRRTHADQPGWDVDRRRTRAAVARAGATAGASGEPFAAPAGAAVASSSASDGVAPASASRSRAGRAAPASSSHGSEEEDDEDASLTSDDGESGSGGERPRKRPRTAASDAQLLGCLCTHLPTPPPGPAHGSGLQGEGEGEEEGEGEGEEEEEGDESQWDEEDPHWDTVDRVRVDRYFQMATFDVDGFSIDWEQDCLWELDDLMGWLPVMVSSHEGPGAQEAIRRGHWSAHEWIFLCCEDITVLVKRNMDGLLLGHAPDLEVNAIPLAAHEVLVNDALPRGDMDPQILDEHLRVRAKPYGHSWYSKLPKGTSESLLCNRKPSSLAPFL